MEFVYAHPLISGAIIGAAFGWTNFSNPLYAPLSSIVPRVELPGLAGALFDTSMIPVGIPPALVAWYLFGMDYWAILPAFLLGGPSQFVLFLGAMYMAGANH